MSGNTASQHSGNYYFAPGTIQNLGMPTLPLPRNTWNGGFINSKLLNTQTKQIIASTPAVDPVTSEYGTKYLPMRFTIRFIEFVNQTYFQFQSILNNARLNYALSIYKRLNNYSLMEIDPNENKARETLLFYLDNQIFVTLTGNLQRLSIEAESLASIYIEKLSKVEYTTGNQRKKLLPTEARSFIEDCKTDVEKHIDGLFQKLNTSAVVSENAPTGNVKLPAGLVAITPAMLMQINPSLPQSRAADLAPFLNQAIAEAQITTLIGEAMFLAQVLHEMGVKEDLNEGGGKKSYNGKIYDYFFYMYDKDSPDPNRQAVAKNLGNTQPGDGVKFHGRGYIQLTGRTNYQNAGNYLGLDLVNKPDLANEPKNSVRIAAWFWRFGNGNLNNFTDKDTTANFETVTRRINGGLTNIEHRTLLFTNAKKVLGIK